MPKGIPNKRYTPEFKQLAAETMQKEKLRIRETSAQFGIGDQGLATKRRGRGRKGRPSKPSWLLKQLT